MSAEQLIGQLTAAAQRLEEAQVKLREAGEATSQARALVSGALKGSSGQLVAQISSLVETLGQVSSKLPVTRGQVQRTVEKVKALGN